MISVSQYGGHITALRSIYESIVAEKVDLFIDK